MVSRSEGEEEVTNFIPAPEDCGKKKLEGISWPKWRDACFRLPHSGLLAREGEMHLMNEVSTEEKIQLSQTALEFHVALVAQTVKNLPAMQEIWVQSVDQEDALEKGLATHSSNLACRISRTEDPAGLQPMGSWELDTTEQLALSHFGRFLRQLRFCLGNYSGISSRWRSPKQTSWARAKRRFSWSQRSLSIS